MFNIDNNYTNSHHQHPTTITPNHNNHTPINITNNNSNMPDNKPIEND